MQTIDCRFTLKLYVTQEFINILCKKAVVRGGKRNRNVCNKANGKLMLKKEQHRENKRPTFSNEFIESQS